MIEFHDEETGGIIYIQTPSTTKYRDVTTGKEVKTIQGRLQDALQSLKTFGKGVIESVQDLEPDEVEVKVGLTLDVSEGKLIGLLAKAGVETAFEVTLKWTAKTDTKPAPKPKA